MATWDEPASACLSSRIPYHSEVTEEKLRDDRRAPSACCASSGSASSACAITTRSRASSSGRDEIARALEPDIAERDRPRAARARLRARHDRSARLPPRQPERGAQAASGLVTAATIGRRRAAADLPGRAPRAPAANARGPRLDQLRARRAALRRRAAPAASARLSGLHRAGEGVDRDAALRRRRRRRRRAASRSGARSAAPPRCPRCSCSSGGSRGASIWRGGRRSSSRPRRCSGSPRSVRSATCSASRPRCGRWR